MNTGNIQLLLADDDIDDCLLFKEALSELPISVNLTTVNDGEQLMRQLLSNKKPPSILFLDLNMPRKNGFECLDEIKADESLKNIPIVIISTSFDNDIVKQLYNNGAQYYIQKPNEFKKLKAVINKAILVIIEQQISKPSFEAFVLQP